VSAIKIVLVGGGSVSWGPKMITDLALADGLQGSTITLMDLDPEVLERVRRLSEMIIERAECDVTLQATTSRQEAFEGADYVVVTISAGGFETMKHDLAIPWKYGIRQSVGDTIGPGGLSRALRNIPIFLDIARDMQAICPQAWLINYSNPMTTICRAITKETQVKTVGLCHELFGTIDLLQTIFGCPREAIGTRVGGVNHLPWIIDLRIDGEDGFPRLQQHLAENGLHNPLAPAFDSSPRSVFADRWAVKMSLFRTFGALPAAGDRHVAEFFPHFLTAETNWGADFGVELTTVAHRERLKGIAHARIENLLSEEEPLILEPSREAASPIIQSLETGEESIHLMNLPNRGQIANLPRDAVVETMGVVGRNSVEPLAIGDLPTGVASIVRRLVDVQELTVEAGLTGDRALALQAMRLDPLVTNWEAAEKMLDELLAANRDWLPQFFD
jgi:alpha-galactosidase